MFSVLKKLGGEFVKELSEADTLLRRAGLLPPDSALEANYTRFGASFGAETMAQFIEVACKFYEEGIDSSDPLYTRVDQGYGRIAIDYNGEIRGIFTTKGKPLAFFRPNYQQFGYTSKEMELDSFKGKAVSLF